MQRRILSNGFHYCTPPLAMRVPLRSESMGNISLNGPLIRLSIYVAMSVCLFVCVFVLFVGDQNQEIKRLPVEERCAKIARLRTSFLKMSFIFGVLKCYFGFCGSVSNCLFARLESQALSKKDL